MPNPHARLTSILLLVIAGAAAWSAFERVRDPLPATHFAPKDPADMAQERFGPLVPFLKGAPSAAYVASRPAMNQAGDMGGYFLAQYIFAPTVLTLGADESLTVTNMDTDVELSAITSAGRFEVLAHPAVGLAVLKKRTP